MQNDQISQVIKGLNEAISKIDDMRDDIGLMLDIVQERAFVVEEDIDTLEDLTEEYQGDLFGFSIGKLLETLAEELRRDLYVRQQQDPTTF